MTKSFDRFLYGGDYNPGQWPRDIWQEDMRIFRNAHINSATINVFSWAKIQPSEEAYCFDELDEVVGMLGREGYDIVMGTSTASLPAWMCRKYPEVTRTDFEGRHHKFGQRHNACPNSPVYQKFSRKMAAALAKRYARNQHIVCWHVNNEYGGECYCENCERAFQQWLKQRYQTLEKVNRAWNTEFWGHWLYEWEEIVAPNLLGEAIDQRNTAFAGISIDYRRFLSDSMLENFKAERDAIRRFDKDTPITTNLMGMYKNLDYFCWAREMDIVSWDNYPAYDTPWSLTAMTNDLMRGLKAEPFMLMEQTPSQQNWQPYNSLKKPGQMRAQSYQSIAHGANTVQFFQLRRSVGGCEKFHGAVIEHAGAEDTRVLREVTRLGKELARVGPGVRDSRNQAGVAMIFDWDNYWALEYTSGPHKDLLYVEQLHKQYRYFYQRNIPVDFVPVDGDFDEYSLLIAPVLYMVKPGMQEKLEAFVRKGGVLVTGFMSGIVDESDLVHPGGYPGPLRQMAGVWAEELDALPPEQVGYIRFQDGTEATCRLVCDLMHLEGAQCLGTYASDFYAGTPAVTRNQFGGGMVYYLGTELEPRGLSKVLDMAVEKAGVKPVIAEATSLEVACRQSEGKSYCFIMNFTGKTQPLPRAFMHKQDLLSGQKMDEQTVLAPYDTCLICE